MEKFKESSARITLYKKLNYINNILTYESSIFGYQENNKIHIFDQEDYISLGKSLCETLLKFNREYSNYFNFSKGIVNRNLKIIEEIKNSSKKENCQENELSDSEPSGDDLDSNEILNNLPKNLSNIKEIQNFYKNKNKKDKTNNFKIKRKDFSVLQKNRKYSNPYKKLNYIDITPNDKFTQEQFIRFEENINAVKSAKITKKKKSSNSLSEKKNNSIFSEDIKLEINNYLQKESTKIDRLNITKQYFEEKLKFMKSSEINSDNNKYNYQLVTGNTYLGAKIYMNGKNLSKKVLAQKDNSIENNNNNNNSFINLQKTFNFNNDDSQQNNNKSRKFIKNFHFKYDLEVDLYS